VNYQHKQLADGRWAKMSLTEQMSNIGSEVSRALNWHNKNKHDLSQRAVIRALELIDLTLTVKMPFSRLKELSRMREALVDFFFGSNQFSSSEDLWRKYFDHFTFACRQKGKS